MIEFKEKFWFGLWIIILATVVGLLYTAPQLLIRSRVHLLGQDFVLSQFTYLDDGGDAYFQFAREVADGHFPPRDLFFDGKMPNIFPSLPPLFLAGLIILFKDVSVAYIVANFLFSSILFLLFLLLGWIVFNKNKAWSVFMGLVGTLTPMAIHLPYAFFSADNLANIVLKNFYPAVKTFLPTLFLARIDYPLLTHLIYLPAIITFFVFWRRPRFITAALAGFLAGLLFYTYFHKWVYWIIVVGLSFGYVLLFNRRNKQLLRNFFFLVGTLVITGIPYFLNYFRLRNFPGGMDLIKRIGIETGHGFNSWTWPYLIFFAILAILIYSAFWKRADLQQRAVFYWLCLLAAAIVLNIQIMLGFVPHPDHWPRAISPLIFLMVFDLVYTGIRRLKFGSSGPVAVLITTAIVLMSVLLVAKKVVNSAGFIAPPQNILNDYTLPENIMSSWRWLDLNYDEPKVISPSFISSIYLSAFTSARPYLPWGTMTSLSNLELEGLFLKSSKVFGVETVVLEKRLRDGSGFQCLGFCDRPYIESNIKDAPLFLYGSYFIDGAEARPYQIPEYKIQELVKRYQELRVGWGDIGAGYVYYGPWEKQFVDVDLSREQKLRLVYKNGLVELYQIK